MESYSCPKCGHYNDRVSLSTRKRPAFTNICDFCSYDREHQRVARFDRAVRCMLHIFVWTALFLLPVSFVVMNMPHGLKSQAVAVGGIGLGIGVGVFTWMRRKPKK